jgi:hypothetical protein
MMTRRELARAALAALAVPFALGCNNGPKDTPATKLDRPVAAPAGTVGAGGKKEAPQKSVKPES